MPDPELQKVTVVIPARNEEDSLPYVLRDLPEVGRVIVVDNNSTDHTAYVADEHGASVVFESRVGYGSACYRGLTAIRDLIAVGHEPPLVVAFVDADYCDQVDLLPKLVRPILVDQADFILGSRLKSKREPGSMNPLSVWGNRFACWLMRRLWGGRYSDLARFRAINYQALCDLNMVDRGLGWSVEMQIKALHAGLRIIEFPMPYHCRQCGQSKISGTLRGKILAGIKILYTIAHYARWPHQPTPRKWVTSRRSSS